MRANARGVSRRTRPAREGFGETTSFRLGRHPKMTHVNFVCPGRRSEKVWVTESNLQRRSEVVRTI
jgi:hypothetical protein